VGWWGELRVWRGFAAAGVAAALLLATALALRVPKAPRCVVVLVAPQDESPGWIVRARRGGELELAPPGRTEVPEERSLQFGTKGDDWPGPVSLGPGAPGRAASRRDRPAAAAAREPAVRDHARAVRRVPDRSSDGADPLRRPRGPDDVSAAVPRPVTPSSCSGRARQ
jgi:anti-sigma-K factor RskA